MLITCSPCSPSFFLMIFLFRVCMPFETCCSKVRDHPLYILVEIYKGWSLVFNFAMDWLPKVAGTHWSTIYDCLARIYPMSPVFNFAMDLLPEWCFQLKLLHTHNSSHFLHITWLLNQKKNIYIYMCMYAFWNKSEWWITSKELYIYIYIYIY